MKKLLIVIATGLILTSCSVLKGKSVASIPVPSDKDGFKSLTVKYIGKRGVQFQEITGYFAIQHTGWTKGQVVKVHLGKDNDKDKGKGKGKDKDNQRAVASNL